MLGIAAVIPICVALYDYYDLIRIYADPAIEPNIRQARHVASVNLMGSGFTFLTLVYFGIRNKIKWCWCLFLFVGGWIGFNDSFAALYNNELNMNNFPIPVVPTTIGLIGIVLTYPGVFRSSGEE